MSNLQFLQDTLIVQEALLDDSFIKNGGSLSSIKDSIVSYFDSHNNPEDPVGTVLNFLAPGAISMLIGGWLGPTFGLAMRVLNIDVASILRSIYNSLKDLLSNGKKVSSNQIDNIVNSSILASTNQTLQTNSFDQQLKDARFLKLAVIDFHRNKISERNLKVIFADRRGKTISVIGKLLGWIIKVAISSAGLMLAGDVVNKAVGKPNAFDHTIQHGQPIEKAPPAPISTQSKFPVSQSYSDVQHTSGSWIENYPNTQSGIENMLIDFTKEVYPDTAKLDSIIRSSPQFKATVDEILFFNHAAAGDPIVFLPKFFTSKKFIVDHFIDSIANKTP